MKRLVLVSLAAGLLAACDNDPQVTEGELPNATDVADTGAEIVESDAPPLAQAGAVSWDQDNDRLFDRNEFTGFGDQGFLGWDANDDDQIGPDEFNRGWTEAGLTDAEGAFDAFDDNNDNLLGNDEFFSESQFGEWDANANATLEREEFAFYGV